MIDPASPISDQEFALFQRLIYKLAGINLSDAKRVLLVGRLGRRLKHHHFDTYTQYYRLLSSGQHADEVQQMVDLLTTNETYFFREPRHFDFLRDVVLGKWRGPGTFRIWSAASSTGEEAYSMAMVLAEHRSVAAWEVFGSDISLTVLARARAGIYTRERIDGIPPGYLHKHCLKGVRPEEGKLLIDGQIKQHVSFAQVNLTLPITGVGNFEVIFLRNVMIYFDTETKRKVIENMLPSLKPGGYFIVGHSESLNGITTKLKTVQPTIYQKPL
ncbi:chemotaxis regulator, protein-glutamate methyltransferase [Candidatus Accumulibacter aalborgensis]|uniref:Chemotaxis protein methyltransferase n=1 Tax=Candidatus Accumulibacter aalborgensis TaxID=1860102 RepID=A0A1A8XJF3_9PROT|nr:protein-glutamate O-methyltransferase CheR [Candidatus Accumulibacter aalborgensis]SBT05314.1 chemotaxis regulator, protein-glutamate methyltransferase [Candidatus Accumulibacter aalborgensis]